MSRSRSSTTSTSLQSHSHRVWSRPATVMPSPDYPPGHFSSATCSPAVPIRVRTPESLPSPNKPMKGKNGTPGGGTVGAGARHPASAFRAARSREPGSPPRTPFRSLEASGPERAPHATSTRQTPSLPVQRAMRPFQEIAKCPLENADHRARHQPRSRRHQSVHSWLVRYPRTRTLHLSQRVLGLDTDKSGHYGRDRVRDSSLVSILSARHLKESPS